MCVSKKIKSGKITILIKTGDSFCISLDDLKEAVSLLIGSTRAVVPFKDVKEAVLKGLAEWGTK